MYLEISGPHCAIKLVDKSEITIDIFAIHKYFMIEKHTLLQFRSVSRITGSKGKFGQLLVIRSADLNGDRDMIHL
jgi:hypothetical protein